MTSDQPWRAPTLRSMKLAPACNASAITNNKTEIAAAVRGAPPSISPRMNTGAVSVLFGMLPATTTTEPNSPSARPSDRMPADKAAGAIAGKNTVRKI